MSNTPALQRRCLEFYQKLARNKDIMLTRFICGKGEVAYCRFPDSIDHPAVRELVEFVREVVKEAQEQ